MPPLVATITALNAAVFLLLTFFGGSDNAENLVRFGALFGPFVEEGQYWRFFTAAFLHIGILHIVFNSYCLWKLGSLLEALYGTVQFSFIYVVSALCGSALSFLSSAIVSSPRISAGASGAIFGVAGAMLVAGFRYEAQIPETLQQAFGKGALPFIAYNLFYGFTHPGIDNWAHLGGAVGGTLCALALRPQKDRPRDIRLAVTLFFGVVLAAFGLQLAVA